MRLDPRSFQWRRFWLVIALGFCLFGGWVSVRFIHARSAIEEEWNRKMPQEPRSPEVVRGLLDSMMAYPEDHLSFLPQSAWDNDVCAGNVISAVNFLLGERRLVDTAAKACHSGPSERRTVSPTVDRSYFPRIPASALLDG